MVMLSYLSSVLLPVCMWCFSEKFNKKWTAPLGLRSCAFPKCGWLLHRYSNASRASPGAWVMPVGCLAAADSRSSLLTILQLKSESNQTQLYEYTVARTLVSRPGLGTLSQDPSPLTFPLSSTCVAQGTTQIIPNHWFKGHCVLQSPGHTSHFIWIRWKQQWGIPYRRLDLRSSVTTNVYMHSF